MAKILFPVSLAAAALFAFASAVSAAELVMFEKEGCPWCARWDAEIAPIYPLTPEGKVAPLRRLALDGPIPDEILLKRRVSFTPTFVLVDDGQEVGRIEGYPGEAFFWSLLGKLLKNHTEFDGGGK